MSIEGNYTAEIVAYARAHGSLYKDPAVRNSDYLVRKFLNTPLTIALLPGVREILKVVYDRMTPGIRLYLHLRARAFDEMFEAHLTQGLQQVIVVGAGFDTRAYRYRLDGVRVFECDHPKTALLKRQRIARWGGDTSHVTYVSVDLVKDPMERVLLDAGYDPNAKSLFICEGLFYYLAEDVVRSILAFIANAKRGSSVMFDYVLRDVYLSPQGHYGASELFSYLAKKKEPVKSTFDFESLPQTLAAIGRLETIVNVKATSLTDKYLRRSDGRQLGPICETYAIAHARCV